MPPPRIELGSSVPQTDILSIELQRLFAKSESIIAKEAKFVNERNSTFFAYYPIYAILQETAHMGSTASNMEETTDRELVDLTLEDSANFVHLMKRYEGKLLRYIHRITSVPHEEAEDILQDVFIKAYQNLHGFDRKLSFSSWIYRIAHNHVISTFRKKKARPQQVDIEEKTLMNFASDLDIIRDVDRALQAEQLRKALASMDVKYREVLVLKFLEEKSYDEIADILKKPKGTVGTLINRAKKQCKKALAELDI